MFNGRRQPSRDGTSRMTRECQVRFCERLGVKFPGPTRQSASFRQSLADVRFSEEPTFAADLQQLFGSADQRPCRPRKGSRHSTSDQEVLRATQPRRESLGSRQLRLGCAPTAWMLWSP